MMSATDKAKIKAFMIRGEASRLLQAVAEDMIAEWHRDLPAGETQFAYLKQALERDGKIIGVDAFIKRIEHIASL
jgi:hypothetical protein